MSTLRDRLADLADDATAQPGAAGDLWDRGRRYGRRRRVGTAMIVVVAVALLGAIVGVGQLSSQSTVEPATGRSAPAVPTRIVDPSPWLEGTDEAGPLGQLAAIQPAERGGWTGSTYGVAGISATTGEYRFLDLPEWSGDDPALAPDGRHVAYWYTGETRLSPNSESGPVVGVAVYDSLTGEVVRHPVATDHGLMINDPLVWVDSDRLVFSYNQYLGGDGDDPTDQSSGDGGPPGLLLWAPASPADPVLLPVRWGTSVRAADGAGRLLMMTDRGGLLVSVDDPSSGTPIAVRGSYTEGDLALAPTGDVAWPKGDRHPNQLTVVPVQGDPFVVPRSGRTFAGVAWLDGRHVAVSRRIGQGYERVALFRVDVVSGESTVLTEYPRTTWRVELATDLLAFPTRDRPAPPRPLDPRLVAAGGALSLFAGLCGVGLWRRRVQP